MAVLKVIELLSQSERGWEDAANKAVADAAKSLRGIRSLYVKEMTAVVQGDRIVEYRLNAKVTFEIEGSA